MVARLFLNEIDEVAENACRSAVDYVLTAYMFFLFFFVIGQIPNYKSLSCVYDFCNFAQKWISTDGHAGWEETQNLKNVLQVLLLWLGESLKTDQLLF